jgi:hypothetical protein
MGSFEYFLPVLCLLFFVEDVRHRAIHWSLFAGAFMCFGVAGLLIQGRRTLLAELPINLAFVGLQLLGLLLYCSFRERRWVNPFIRHMGAGDPLFLLACAPLFPRHVFVLFTLSGIAFALLGYGLLRLFLPKQPATVPTAGLMALYLGVWFAMKFGGALDIKVLNQWLANA